MSTRSRIKCSGCGKRIPAQEPDLVLRKLGSERLRYFHTRCGKEAQRYLLKGAPDVWQLTVRHVDEAAS